VPPTLVRPARRTLERGQWNPRTGYSRLSHARTGRRRDVEPVRRVSSIAIGLMQPSPTPRHHPGHCSTIPGAVGVQDNKTSPRPPLCDRRPSVSSTLELTHERRPEEKVPYHHPHNRSWTDTGLVPTLCQKQDSPRRLSPLWHCTPYRHV
jgi:hypothetical protein